MKDAARSTTWNLSRRGWLAPQTSMLTVITCEMMKKPHASG